MSGPLSQRGRRLAGLTTGLAIVIAVIAGAAAVGHRPASAHVSPPAVVAGSGLGDTVTADRPLAVGAGVEVLPPSTDGFAQIRLHGQALPPPAEVRRDLRQDVTWVQDSRRRTYRIIVPHGLPRSAPLVIALPGYRQGLGLAERQQQWARQATAGRFIAVYAQSYNGSWDAGLCCGSAKAGRVDDVGYLDALITRVRATHPVDPRRIFLAGFSNGGMMAHRYACERAGAVAAIASFAGPLETISCRPGQPVAVLQVQGLADQTVPAAGRAYDRNLRSRLRSAQGTVQFWQQVDGTATPVRLLLRARLGHRWPTDGAALAWAFFAANPQR